MKSSLVNWLNIWNPHYRMLIVLLLLSGIMTGCLVYAQNYLLTSLIQILIAESPESNTIPALTNRFHMVLQTSPPSPIISLPVVLLLLFILFHFFSTVLEFINIYLSGKLRITSRTDLEAEVLMHLLNKDDGFFNIHSTSEIVNRISLDVFRVCERRCILMRFWWAIVLILGNLIFFIQNDWRMALLAISFCLTAASWTYIMTRGVKNMDKEYLYQDDSVKSRFGDFLQAAPEIQVGSLFGKVLSNFIELQNDRAKTYMKYVHLSGIVQAGNMVSAFFALAGAILVVMYSEKTGVSNHTLALLPVVIMTLPTLFANASQLVTLNIDFQLASNSMIRLLEYETQREGEAISSALQEQIPSSGELKPFLDLNLGPVPASTIRLEDVTYLYHGIDGTRQGVADINASFKPGRWTAIAGHAGCGKSTLVKLLIGRLHPQKGHIHCGDTIITTFDNRLSSRISFMPQSLALLQTTIYENLFLGRVDAPWGQPSPSFPSLADLKLIEAAGIDELCRLKSLDMTPKEPATYSIITRNLTALRSRAKAFFVQQGMKALPPGEIFFNPNLWFLEILLKGKCHPDAVNRLMGEGDWAVLKKLNNSKLASYLLDRAGKKVIQPTKKIIIYGRQPSTGFPKDSCLTNLHLRGGNSSDILSAKEKAGLFGLALTSPLDPSDLDAFSRNYDSLDCFRKTFSSEVQYLTELLGDSWRPFEMEQINPYLTWRENFSFGVQGPLAELLAMRFIEEEGLGEFFTRIGLEFDIGRLGGNLSGGQGQLVAFGRALLRRYPMLVLDEPTSSLDSVSKIKLAKLLQTWKKNRIVITVSHDLDFIAWADEIILMDSGRITFNDSVSDAGQDLKIFQRVFRKS